MGLAEKRAVQTVKENNLKTFEAEAKNVCGFAVGVDVDWSSLENHKDCVWIVANNKPQTEWFDKTKEALVSICADAMGKTALKEKLKKIYYLNSSGELVLKEGTLTIPSSLDGQGIWGADQITDYLEKQL